MELEPRLVVAKVVAGWACPVEGVFAFLDSLLGCAPTLIELRYALNRGSSGRVEGIIVGDQSTHDFKSFTCLSNPHTLCHFVNNSMNIAYKKFGSHPSSPPAPDSAGREAPAWRCS